MRTLLLRVATFAFLLVGVNTSALAQEAPQTDEAPPLPQPQDEAQAVQSEIPADPQAQPGPPPSPPLGDAKCKPGQEPPCYLTSEHYDALGTRIEALKAEIAGLKGRLEEVSREKQQAEEGGNPKRAEQLEAAQGVLVQKIEALTKELGRLTDTLGAQTVVPSYAGFKWGALVRSGVPLSTGSPERAIPIQGEGAIRWVSRYHLGLELAAALGVWQTDDVAPLAFTSRFAGVASFADGGFFVGPEVSVLQNHYREDPALLLVTLPVGAEWHIGRSPWTLRAAVAPTLHSELARQSGQPWLQFGFGYVSQ